MLHDPNGKPTSQRVAEKQEFRTRDTKVHCSNRREPQLTGTMYLPFNTGDQPSQEKLRYYAQSSLKAYTGATALFKRLDSRGIGGK